jgi:hypothetical protein
MVWRSIQIASKDVRPLISGPEDSNPNILPSEACREFGVYDSST